MDQDLVELIWCAGFWDGEGCSHGYRGGPKSRPNLQFVITQSAPDGIPETLARFQRRLGGRIYPMKSQSEWSKQPRWQWQANGRAGRQVMAQLLPYLSEPKLAQYDRAIERVAQAKELRLEG